MNDPAFRGKLSAARVEHQKAVRSRNEIAKKMQAKIEALKARLGTDDVAKLKPELEKDAEWNDLHKQCQEANAKIAAQRKGTLSAVKERLMPPKKPISK